MPKQRLLIMQLEEEQPEDKNYIAIKSINRKYIGIVNINKLGDILLKHSKR